MYVCIYIEIYVYNTNHWPGISSVSGWMNRYVTHLHSQCPHVSSSFSSYSSFSSPNHLILILWLWLTLALVLLFILLLPLSPWLLSSSFSIAIIFISLLSPLALLLVSINPVLVLSSYSSRTFARLKLLCYCDRGGVLASIGPASAGDNTAGPVCCIGVNVSILLYINIY